MRVRLVHLEDDEGDRERVARTLRGEGIDCAVIEAGCRAEFERALETRPDLIISDYSVPGCGGDEAQSLAQLCCPDVPFMFVSDSIGEERAVERLKTGATDYVLKDRLDKLGIAVKRALREAEERRRRTAAENALRHLNAQLEARVIERTRELVSTRDELNRVRHEADRANLARNEFLSRMSHDLRTPLNAIIGFAQLLELGGLAPDQADNVRQILRGGDHLLSLIDQEFDPTRREPGSDGVGIDHPFAPPPATGEVSCTGLVLYIEDNASNVVLMERLLTRRPGVRLQHAPDGRTGLAMLKAARPSLVILDLHLSDMPGDEVLQRIWSDPSTRDVPVAVLSADASGGTQRQLRAAGAIAYLTKPLDIAEVLRLIDEVVGGSQANRS
jgi:CheY-like chemotaxis protein